MAIKKLSGVEELCPVICDLMKVLLHEGQTLLASQHGASGLCLPRINTVLLDQVGMALAVLCCVMLCCLCVVLCCVALRYVVLCYVVLSLCYVALRCVVLYSIVLYCIILYFIVLFVLYCIAM